MPKARDTSNINWEDYFYYDESSPTFLRHKAKRLNVEKDVVAGTIKKSTGYANVRLHNKIYQVHRVLWEMFNGRLGVDDKIDHIDGNPSNNSLSNLRSVTEDVNQRNKSMYKNNLSGYVGVTFNASGYWVANWYDGCGKMSSKYFSVRKYDFITAKIYAIHYRKTMFSKISHLGYTERHGCKI